MDRIPSQLPHSWYPVARSKDIKRLEHICIKLFDADWIIFRTQSGAIGMTARFCCHIGTDLSNGKVVGETIECPMHGWRFETGGKCTLIPVQSAIPDQVRLSQLNCEEHYGIIFAFYGGKPLFDFPQMRDLSKDLKHSPPLTVPLAAPHHILALNTFDTQHYEKIHSRRFLAPPLVTSPEKHCLRIEYTAEIIKKRWIDYAMDKLTNTVTSVAIEAWGGSILLLKNADTGIASLVCAVPTSNVSSVLYITALKDKNVRQPCLVSSLDGLLLRVAAVFLKSYLSPDLNVIANIRPHKGVLLDEADDSLRHFFRYWDSLPGISPDAQSTSDDKN